MRWRGERESENVEDRQRGNVWVGLDGHRRRRLAGHLGGGVAEPGRIRWYCWKAQLDKVSVEPGGQPAGSVRHSLG